MEERILFEIQRFADTINAGESKTIDGITYTAKNGNITIEVDTTKKSATVSDNAEISESIYQAVTGYTFKINNATINGITFNGNGNVTYGKNHWFVTLNSAFTVGNGTQPLGGLDITTDEKVNLKLYAVGGGEDTVNVSGIKFSSKSSGNVTVSGDEINLSGNVSASKNLKDKTVTTSGEGTVNLLLAESDTLTIDGSTYTAKDAAVVSVTDKKVTSESGTLTVTPRGSVTINGVIYSSPAANSTIELDEGDATLTGKFTLTAKDFVKINKVKVKGESFTFDADTKNFTGTFQTQSSYGKNFKVNGVDLTIDGETATAEVTNSLTKLTGSYTVGDGKTSLSKKNFEVSGGEISFQTLKNDSVKINDATFIGNENFKLTAYFADNDVIKVDGTDIDITGNGKFILVDKAAKINGVDFTADNAYTQVDYAEDSTVTLSNAFTIGDGSQNIRNLKISAQSVIKGSTFKLGSSDSITIGGVTYSGDGEISVDANDADKITLSGKISSVTEEVAGNLTSKNFTVENKNTTVDFILSNENDTVTINDKIYKATADKASIKISNGTVTSGNIVTVTDDDNQTVDLELTATKKTVTYEGVTFTATGTTQVDGETKVAAVTVEEKKVTIDDGTEVSKKVVNVTGGNVDIKFTDENKVTNYTFNLGQDAAATINDVTFKQESNESSTEGDIVFTEDVIILNTAFTVGNGTQKLGGAKFKLGTSAKSTFILGGDNDSVTVENYSEVAESGDGVNVTGDTVTGITYSGSGTVQVSGTTITLNGAITVESTVNVSSYTFNLTSGHSYTFGATTINASSTSATVNVSGISPTTFDNTTSLSSVKIGTKVFSITNGGSYTISLDDSGNISSIGNVSAGASFTADNKTFNVSDMTGTATFNFNESSAVTSVTATSSAKFTIGDKNYTLTSGKTLTDYGTDGWATAKPYASYILEVNGSSLTLKGSDNSIITDASDYSDYFTVNSSSASLSSGIKMQIVNKGNGNFTMNSNGKSYTIAGNSTGTFDSSDSDGITKVDSGTITAANSSAVVTDLGDNAALKVGTIYTYTENGTVDSASINVDANGNVSVSNGEIKKNIASGTFTYGGETYTVTEAAGFKVTSALSDGTSLTGGTGTRSINQGDTFTLNGETTYTADSGAKFVATGDNDGGSVNFSGTAKYSATLDNETETSYGKTYTFNGNATYQLTGTGVKDGTSTKLYAATGTRDLTETGVTKTYNSDTYTVTDGIYSVTIEGGTRKGNESLTSGNAMYTTNKETFHYNNNVYTATTWTQLNISFNGETVTEGTKSGAGTRDKLIDETVSADGSTYTLSNGAKILLTFGTSPEENFYSGNATRQLSANDTFTVTGNANTYTATDNTATLTLTRSRGANDTASDSYALTGGNGTRTDSTSNQTFTINNQTYTDTTNAVVYILNANETSEKLQVAQGTRTFTNGTGKKDFGGDSYTVTDGTYAVTVSGGNISGNESLTAGNATYTTNGGTFHYNGKTYTETGVDSANFALKFDGSDYTITSAAGTGTRNFETDDDVSVTYDSDTYKAATNSVIQIAITDKDNSALSFVSGNATMKAEAASNGTFHYGDEEYTAVSDTTISLSVGNDTVKTFAANSAGTRTDTDDATFIYSNQTYTTTSDNIIYAVSAAADTSTLNENIQQAKGTRTNVADDKYAYGNQNHTYTLTRGTYTIDISGGTGTDTLTAGEGTATITTDTFTVNSKDYTPMGNVDLKIVVSNNGNTQTETFESGKGTRTDTAATFTSGGKTYDNTGDITYLIVPDTDEKVYAATGTRAFDSHNTDSGSIDFNGDTYTVTDGTYNVVVNDENPTETLTKGNATYTTNNGTFHFGNQTYTATAETKLQISFDGETKTLTEASGTGTRKETNKEQFKYISTDGNTYTVEDNSIIQVDITDTTTSAETFKSGTATATYTTNSGTFHYGDKEYTTSDTATLTLNKADSTETVTLSGKGTRIDSASTFVYSGNSQIYDRTSDNIVYIVENTAPEVVYSAKGTRQFDNTANQTYSVNSGNTYTMTDGVYEIDISAKMGTDTVKSGNATYTMTENGNFVYDGNTYTTKNNTTFTLAVANFNPTETFESGSGELNGTYIIKKSSVQINGTTYENTATNVVKVTTNNNAITGVDGALTATFVSNSATIDGISYSGNGKTLTIGANFSNITANGDFTASGNFQNSKTVKINSKDLTISGDNAVGFNFGTDGVTEINNLSNGATVTDAAGATKAVSDANGTFTFGSQTITIDNDSTPGATFTLDGNGIATKIEGIQRNDSSNYVKITIGGNTYNIRKTGAVLSRNATTDNWTIENDLTIESYSVNYAGGNTITVKANNGDVTLTTDDYTFNTETKVLTITNTANKPVTVTNTSSTPIQVGGVTGIGSGTVYLATKDASSFQVNNSNGKSYTVTNGIFTVENSGISVKASDASTVSITAPADGSVSLEGNGTFSIDGTTINVTGTTSSNNKNVLSFSGANLSGISSVNGTITITPTGTKTYTVNGQTFTISSPTTLNPVDANSINVQLGNVTYKGMQFGGNSQATLNGNTITFASGAKVTDTKTTATFNVTGTVEFDGIELTNASNTTVKNVDTATTKLTIADNELQVKGDNTYTIDVSANKLSNINGNVTISGDFVKGKTIETSSAGKFKIGTSEEFTITGDTDVILTTDANGKVTAISGLSGTIEGNFTSEISVNGQAVNVTGDNAIGVVGDNSKVTKIYSLDGGANVQSSGGATTLSTSSNGTFTFGTSQKFSIGVDSSVDFTKDSAAATVKGVSNLDNGNSIVFYQGETGFNVDNDTITLTSASSPVTLKVDGNNISEVKNLQSNINGLQANTKVQVATSNAISINTGLLQISESNADFTVNAANGGYNSIGGINSSAQITTAKNASVVTDATGTYTFPASHTFTIANNSGNVTLNTNENSSVTAIGGLQENSNITFSSAESNLKVGNDTVTFTDNNLKLTMGNNTVSGVEDLTGTISGLFANATVRVKTSNEVGINNTALHIANDGDITVRAKSGGYDSVAGVNSGAKISVAAANTTLRTNQNGTFTFQRNGTYTTNDSDVAFVIKDSSYLDDIRDLVGQVQGDFTNEVKINEKSVLIGSDNDISITADANGVTKIEKLTSPANDDAAIVYNAGGATTISTDNYGKFQFGNTNSHSFSISGGTADFQTASLSSWVPSVTGIRNIDNNASILVYQDETALTVEDKLITLAENTSPVTLAMGGDTISSVTNITGKIDGLSSGAAVTVKDSDVTINGTELKIEESGGTDFVAYSLANDGYVSITGVNASANISAAKNTSIVTSGAGTFTVNNKIYKISGDNEVTLATDDNSNITAIGGLAENAQLVLSQAETITINGKPITFGGATEAEPVTLTMGSGDTISEVKNLKGDINGLAKDATITVTTGDEITVDKLSLMVNENVENNYVVIAKKVGYSTITGVSGDATIATEEGVDILTDSAGKFTFLDSNNNFTGEYTISGDNNVSIKTDDDGDVLSISSLESGTLQAAVKGTSANEVKVTLNGTALYSNDTDVSIVTADSAITSIIGLGDGGELTMPASTYVSVKGYNDIYNPVNVTINADTFDIAGDIDGIVISEGGKVITGLDGDARLTVSAEGEYTVNNTPLTIAAGTKDSLKVFIGENVNSSNAASARLYQSGEISFGDFTPAEQIAENILGSDTSAAVLVTDTSETSVTLNDETKLAVVKADDVNITASGTGDTVISSGSNVTVDVNSASNTVIMPTSGSITINNYSEDKASIMITNSDVAAAVRDKTLTFTDENSFTVNNGATVNLTNKTGDYISFANSSGRTQKTRYSSGEIEDTVSKADLLLIADTVKSGSGNDSAFGSAGGYFDMGSGKNYVEISTGEGISSVAATTGSVTVKGFDADKDFSKGDVAKLNESAISAINSSTGKTTAKFDGSAVVISDDNGDILTLNLETSDNFVNVNLSDGKNTKKTSIAKDNADITVAENTDENEFANAYVGGTNSGVDLTNFDNTATLSVDLSEGEGEFGGSSVTFRDIARVKGSDGIHTIKGAANTNNTLEAGKGSATIWGYGKKSDDVLIGNSNQDTYSTFLFDGADGKDTIQNFQFYTKTREVSPDEAEPANLKINPDVAVSYNSDTADVLYVKQERSQKLSNYSVSGENVVINMTDSVNNGIIIEGARDKAFRYKLQNINVSDSDVEEWITKVSDNKITYDGVTQFYKTTSKNATLQVAADFMESTDESRIIYLNGKVNALGENESMTTAGIDFKIVGLDASSVTSAVTLVGNSANNVIKIGDCGGGLWGTDYSFGNDTLIGGSGNDTFAYGMGEGDDTVQNFGTDDVIYIHNKTLDDLKYEVTQNNISVTGKDSDKQIKIQFSSGSITVVKDSGYTGNVKFKLKDGSTTCDGIDALKTNINLASSGDLAEDWGDIFNYETPIDSEPVFWNGESADLSTDEVNNISELYRETSIGEIQFSITGAESFVDEIKSTAKK